MFGIAAKAIWMIVELITAEIYFLYLYIHYSSFKRNWLKFGIYDVGVC